MKPTNNSKINVNLKDLATIECPNCNKGFFITVWQLRRVPAVVSKSGKDEILPIAGFQCVNCGNILFPD